MSMWPPRIIPNEVAESKNEAPGRTVTVSLPALTRSGSLLALVRVRADAEDAVLRLQHDLDARREVVRHEGRQADAEVDVLAVAQLAAARAASSSRVRGTAQPSCPAPARGRTVRRSIRLSAACSGVSASTRWTNTPGRCT